MSDEADAGGSQQTWTVLDLLRWTAQHFESRGIETARLDAELLLAHALGTSRLRLYLDFEKPVLEEERARFRELVRHRASERVPVSQLLGEKEFWSLNLKVSSDVLTPRPDSETLVSAALDRLPDPDGAYRVLDIGTGSGAIALAIAHERPKAMMTATDISTAALQIAGVNADQLQLSDRIRFLEGSLFEPVRGEEFDLVVSNPPYLARSEAGELPPELDHEPEEALFGGEDGFALLRPLVGAVVAHLVDGGGFAVELSPGQEDSVAQWCMEAGLVEIETLRDLARQPRVVAARRGARGPQRHLED
ncbi:MAG: peptide chain release factor N(5)-glutamine methyltransferase [Deltaproteobacteria bacterium]|nr:peptide chain release factor N(5)-glutamine methyltransferase [Deltaproteobacteria bacterium]MBW2417134.1 peptide chain release factor N(5)-glutamine methyltransferase [Deltaproteobacteria bacterium]